MLNLRAVDGGFKLDIFITKPGKDSKLEIFILCSDGLKFVINHHHPDLFLTWRWICEQQKSASISPTRSRSAISQPNLMVKETHTFLSSFHFPACQDTKLTVWSTHCDRWERDVGHPLQEKHGIWVYRCLFFWISFWSFLPPHFFFLTYSDLVSVFFHSRVGKNHQLVCQVFEVYLHLQWYTANLPWKTNKSTTIYHKTCHDIPKKYHDLPHMFLMIGHKLTMICLGVCRFSWDPFPQCQPFVPVTKSWPSPWFVGDGIWGSKTLRFPYLVAHRGSL